MAPTAMHNRLRAVRERLHAASASSTVTFTRGNVALTGLSNIPCRVTSDLDTLVDSDLQIEAVLKVRTVSLPATLRPNATCQAVVTDWKGRVTTYNVLRWVPVDGTVGGIERAELKRP